MVPNCFRRKSNCYTEKESVTYDDSLFVKKVIKFDDYDHQKSGTVFFFSVFVITTFTIKSVQFLEEEALF